MHGKAQVAEEARDAMVTGVPTFMLGLAFGWVYLKTRSIWPAIFAHTLHNTVVLITVWQEIGQA